jgi:small subunit ribosomal protein S5
MADFEKSTPEFEERVVAINRNSKVVKGGRRFSFAALVVVGNKSGKVGFGTGKAKEVSEAIRKATEAAHKNIQTITLREGTIPHETEVKFSATKVMLKPASAGTGVISGASARAVLELAGVHDILTKTYGSTNPRNVVQATIEGLVSQKTKAEMVAHRNGGK